MSPGSPVSPFTDAVLACRLLLMDPQRFGGIVLRGASPARDALVAALQDALTSTGAPVRRLPGHVDDTRLLGGIDIAASLASGRPAYEKGLLEQTRGGALIVPMAERLETSLAGRLLQALDEGADAPALILLDDGIESDEVPPQSLMERCAFHCDLSGARESSCEPLSAPSATGETSLDDEARAALVSVAISFGIASARPLLFAQSAACLHASLAERSEVEKADLAAAVRLVLAPRALQMPPMEDPADDEPESEPPPPEPPDEQSNEDKSDPSKSDKPLEDMLIEAVAAALPADLLAQLAQGKASRRSGGGGTGKRRKSGLRGKPLGARPGMPRGGARLALIDTLRAAVPWQEVRRREAGIEGGIDDSFEDGAPIQMRKDDLRVRRFEDKAARVTIFALDASGSAAAARLAEAKGAIELMLAQAYVTRSEVAVIAFRADRAELLLAPTRSLTRARRALTELPGGGGTPLAMGLNAAFECAEMVMKRGRSPSLVILTDGRANVDGEGQPGRKQAGEDAQNAAKAIARAGLDAIVIDISARAGPEGAALADMMQARYLALPRADANTLASAIESVEVGRREARLAVAQ